MKNKKKNKKVIKKTIKKAIKKIIVKESPLFWPAYIKGNALFVLDETLIPKKIVYNKAVNVNDSVRIIQEMKTRAFGQLLVVLYTFLVELNFVETSRRLVSTTDADLLKKIQQVAEKLNNSRPTFPFSEVTGMVIGFAYQAIEKKIDIKMYVGKCIEGYLAGIRERRLDRVKRIAEIIFDGDKILTHCNVSGELAMAAYICKQQKKKIEFFATETRPYFQGAKLTCWELKKMGAKVTLIADNAVGNVMADRKIGITKVIVGSDRSCANGDFANKIGTYQIAVLAKEFGIPFYVLTQPSDKVKEGKDIPIEIRDGKELFMLEGKSLLKKDVDGFYPGFDVVGHQLVTGTIAINVHGR